MAVCGDPLVELAGAETQKQAACAFLNCVKSDLAVTQGAVYVGGGEPWTFHLTASTSSTCMSDRASSLPMVSCAQEAITAAEDRHVCVADIESDSPLRHVLDFDGAEVGSVVKCCVVSSRHDKDHMLAVCMFMCRHPPADGIIASLSTTVPFDSLRNIFAISLERLSQPTEKPKNSKSLWKSLYRLSEYRYDSNGLAIELCRVVKDLFNADAMMFFVDECREKLLCTVRNLAVPTEDIFRSVHSSPYGSVVGNHSCCIIPNLDQYSDDQLLLGDDGRRPESVICAAITTKFKDGHVELVGVLAISRSSGNKPFSASDLSSIKWLVEHVTPMYVGVLLNDRLCVSKVHSEALLLVARRLFSNISDMSQLLKDIMRYARDLINAERCSLFLVQKDRKNKQDLVAWVFDGEIVSEGMKRKVGMTTSIAGMVAQSGQLANIADVEAEPLFCPEVDKETGFKTRNLLCFPILGRNDKVVGVAQLVNKLNGQSFTVADEDIAKSFAMYCGIAIVHSRLLEKAVTSHHRSRLATELMAYHMQKHSAEDLQRLLELPATIPVTLRDDIISFKFVQEGLGDMIVMQALVGMFEDMGFLKVYKIPRDVLCRFLLTVKQGYRHPPYHNWDHAFSVAHFCYCLWKRCGRLRYLDDLELLGLFVGCVCHDVDHRGTNNAFQVNSRTVLAALYSSEGSVMEHHHFSQTMCIMTIENCNIFANLSQEDYLSVMDIIREVILATDIVTHLSAMQEMKEMVADGISIRNPRHKNLLLSLIMTCCDLNSVTKRWTDAQSSAYKLYSEFFTQGDLEKALNISISPMTDRESACIPQQQVDFAGHIAEPAYKLLHSVYPETSNVLQRLRANQSAWQSAKAMYDEGKFAFGLPSCSITLEEAFHSITCAVNGEDYGDSDIDESTCSKGPSADQSESDSEAEISDSPFISADMQQLSMDSHPLTPAKTAPSRNFLPLLSSSKEGSKQRARLQVYDTYLSRRASHLIGADYTLQAAQLQASSGTPIDLLPEGPLGGSTFDHPIVDRVTDPVHSQLESRAKELAQAAESYNQLNGMHKPVQRTVESDVPMNMLVDTTAEAGDRIQPSPVPSHLRSPSEPVDIFSSQFRTQLPGRMSPGPIVEPRISSFSIDVVADFSDDEYEEQFYTESTAPWSAESADNIRGGSRLSHSVSDHRLFRPRRSWTSLGEHGTPPGLPSPRSRLTRPFRRPKRTTSLV